MTSQQPHPLRCETCKHHGEYTPYKMECPLYGYEYNACQMDCITRLIGCASHSDASNPEHCADTCIYKRFAKNMENAERHDREVREKLPGDLTGDYRIDIREDGVIMLTPQGVRK